MKDASESAEWKRESKQEPEGRKRGAGEGGHISQG